MIVLAHFPFGGSDDVLAQLGADLEFPALKLANNHLTISRQLCCIPAGLARVQHSIRRESGFR